MNADADLNLNFHSRVTRLADGRVRARTVVAGKTFEAFDKDETWASRRLQGVVEEAVKNGDVILNKI
jgi:predicted transcriptional regulator